MTRTLRPALVITLAWLICGCAVQVRQLDSSKIAPGDHRVMVHSTSAQLAHNVAKAAEDANFQVTPNEFDWRVILDDERIAYDELTPDISRSTNYRLRHYRVSYSIFFENSKAASKSGQIKLSEQETDSFFNDLQTFARDEAQRSRFRREAARLITEILIDHISSVEVGTQ